MCEALDQCGALRGKGLAIGARGVSETRRGLGFIPARALSLGHAWSGREPGRVYSESAPNAVI